MKLKQELTKKLNAFHEKAMDLVDKAFVASNHGDGKSARDLTEKALACETQAANLLKHFKDTEPTRSVLFRSAASLALQCNKLRVSESLIEEALNGNPPTEIRGELKSLLAETRRLSTRKAKSVFDRSAKSTGIKTYEVMYIVDPEAPLEKLTKLNEAVGKLIAKEGGTVVRMDDGGRRTLAYPIKKKTQGHYVLFEIKGSGQEIAELERRMRVNDMILRYITVRVDDYRKKATEVRKYRRRETLKAAARKQASTRSTGRLKLTD